jgi:hypothetical protein
MNTADIRKEAEKYGVDIAQPIIRSMFSCSRGQLAVMLSVAYLDGARRMNEEAAEMFERESCTEHETGDTCLAARIRALMPAEDEK